MKLEIRHMKENELTGKKPQIRLAKARLIQHPTHAILELKGYFSKGIRVTMSLAGVMLFCEYGTRCPIFIELVQTMPRERSATTAAHKFLLERTSSSTTFPFFYRTGRTPECENAGSSDSRDSVSGKGSESGSDVD